MKRMNYTEIVNMGELEAKANHYTVRCQINSFLILTAVWLLNVFDIFIIDSHLMNLSYIISFFITLACCLVCRFGDAEKNWMKYILLFLTVLFATTVGTFLTYQAVLVTAVPICYSMHYYKRKVVYYTYVLTIIGIFVSTMTGYFYGLCDANMLVLTTGPMAKYVHAGTDMALFEAINTNPWGTLPLYYVLPRCMILFAVIIISSHAVQSSAKKAIQEIELTKRSETDGMTGLFNKNKYMEMVEKHYPKVATVGVLFWDADGLKKLNDANGHEEGDQLISAVGTSVHMLCSETRHGYRVGGDEFVLIMENADEAETRRVMEEWKLAFEKINRKSKKQFCASVGYAVGLGEQVEEVVRMADERMYETKKLAKGEE